MKQDSFDDQDWLGEFASDDANVDDLFESIMREFSSEATVSEAAPEPEAVPEISASPAKPKKAAKKAIVPDDPDLTPPPAKKARKEAEPVPEKKAKKAKKQKRRFGLGSVIFYTLYLMSIAFAAGAIYLCLLWLHGWLQDYQAAQPDVKSAQVFQQHFAKPDWAELYKLAGGEDTEYEGAAEYAAYMAEKIGDTPLDYVETSAGLSGDKKFIVRANGEKVATFTLEGEGKSVTDIPNWQMGKVEVFFTRTKGANFTFPAGCTVYVNGVPLGEEFTTESQSTFISKYLKEPTILSKTDSQSISGLLMPPRVEIMDENGNVLEPEYNEETNTYVVPTVEKEAFKIPEDAKTAVLKAAESYAGFMINASNSGKDVAKYFDTSRDVYKQILSMNSELWMNADRGHTFTEESVSQYIPSGTDEFTARVHVNMNVNCKDNTKKDYTVDTTMLFHKKNGNWVCYEMTNEELLEHSHTVRLTFKMDDTILSDEFYEVDSTELQTPTVTAPSGKVFSGWVRQDIDEQGNTALTVVFEPDENGVVKVPAGTLTPAVLYPLFENA